MTRVLDPARGVKPLDFGGEGVTGSVDINGRLIALNAYHPQEGYVTFTVAPSFTEKDRYDQKAVRAYRAGLVTLSGFGPHFEPPIQRREVRLLGDAIPQLHLEFGGGGSATTTILALQGGVLQHWDFRGVTPLWKGKVAVQRATYSQLTEGGPLPPAQVKSKLNIGAGLMTLTNPAIQATAAIAGFSDAAGMFSQGADGPVDVKLPPETRSSVFLSYGFARDEHHAVSIARQLQRYATVEVFDALLQEMIAKWEKCWSGVPDDLILRRALLYGQIMAVPVTDEATCILTDHMLLPLSWNRDAYFVMDALVRWERTHLETMRRHLKWMFEIAERPNNEWGRCYLASGQQKDPAYQLDQQLFPLLELAEYTVMTGDGAFVEHIQPVMNTLLKRRIGPAWLFPTEETPADDPVAYPYHFSSHLLLWHMLQRLQAIIPGYRELSRWVYRDIQRYFIVEREGKKLFAYAVDGLGNASFYHDANDVPLAMAPVWGFTTTDDPVWLATIDFAFSPANEGGYYGDGFLGSVHTRAPWALGDCQRLLIGRLLGDREMETQARDHLQRAAQWDGALSEGYDASTFDVVSRHWFAWPNALYAGLIPGAM
ncbi:MAG: glycoside hydrolase family 125 protein [Chloroflexi bacterium]|nr:glycoside hydrolase family 125 protein [Chloroflexota bacterium]